MLNAFLTVRHRQPASHRNIGWEHFTDAVIQKLSEERQGLVFLLWGNFARSKSKLIDTGKHYILEAPHPSPFQPTPVLLVAGIFRNQ
ncbi:MAG: uracil-DNA glycosylase family protein [Owenweeksia sp.]|nr:uracil-DNA glycosylase family protein [Owenweeksia sp.]